MNSAMCNLVKMTLREISKIENGKARKNENGKIPIYGGNGILGYCNNYNYTGENIIIGRVGAYCGAVYYENNPIWVSDNALLVKTKNNVNPRYLYYLLKWIDLNQFAEGSSHPLITQSLLYSLEIDFHKNKVEQKAIASVLSSLDDKIDLLNLQNKTLEAMAEALFRQWFVEEAGEDWEEVELGSVIETTSGGTPSRNKMEYYDDGIFHWVKSKELNRSYLFETEEKISEIGLKNSSAKLLPKNSILVAMYGATVGEYAIIADEMTCNQAVCAVKSNKEYPYTFLFLFFKRMREEIVNMAVGSAQQNISQILIKQLLVPACFDRINEFHNETEYLFEKIKLNCLQIRTLEKLRDTLLPKLMSGEVRVAC